MRGHALARVAARLTWFVCLVWILVWGESLSWLGVLFDDDCAGLCSAVARWTMRVVPRHLRFVWGALRRWLPVCRSPSEPDVCVRGRDWR